jgi:hypothetical protein
MLIIGSLALKHHVPSFDRRIMDVDFISTRQEYESTLNDYKKVKGLLGAFYPVSGETMIIKLNSCSSDGLPSIREYNIAYEDTSNKMILDYCEGLTHAPLNVLLLLKMSHRYKKNSPFFLKTMQDIHYLRSLGATLDNDPVLQEILKVREKETYTYDHPKLNQNKDSFFVQDESFYVYDHDDIHAAVATLDKPAYLYFKPENSQVMVSKKMWDQCSLDIKLRAGLEESMVLALERSLVPCPGVLTPRQAFNKALEKVCTSITSGWFREFCWENHEAIQSLYSDDFVDKFNKAVEAGQVKDFKRNGIL